MAQASRSVRIYESTVPERLVSNAPRQDEAPLDLSLRPQKLADYIGQDQVKANLKIAIDAARLRGEPLDHVLLYGPPGLGKTTLAHILATEMGSAIKITSGPAIERAGDLAAILTNISQHGVLFIDEVHRLPRIVEETLYPALEDFALDIVMGKGPGSRSLRLRLPPFTVIGATTRYAALSAPLRERFGIVHRLDFYDQAALEAIVVRASEILRVPIDAAGVTALAQRSRGTPRVANRLLKRVRDFAQVLGDGSVNGGLVSEAMAQLGVDPLGLDSMDHLVLKTIVEKFSGGPVGLDTIAASTSEEADTIMDVYEPYLLQLGFLERTPRGRIATPLAYEHLGLPRPSRGPAPQPTLWDAPPDG